MNYSESGKEVSSKSDSVRESSEIHHSSRELLNSHRILKTTKSPHGKYMHYLKFSP